MLDVFEKHLNHKSFLDLAEKAITKEEQIAFCLDFLDKNSPETLAKNAKPKDVYNKVREQRPVRPNENMVYDHSYSPVYTTNKSLSTHVDLVLTLKIDQDSLLTGRGATFDNIEDEIEYRIKHQYPEFDRIGIKNWDCTEDYPTRTILVRVEFRGYYR